MNRATLSTNIRMAPRKPTHCAIYLMESFGGRVDIIIILEAIGVRARGKHARAKSVVGLKISRYCCV